MAVHSRFKIQDSRFKIDPAALMAVINEKIEAFAALRVDEKGVSQGIGLVALASGIAKMELAAPRETVRRLMSAIRAHASFCDSESLTQLSRRWLEIDQRGLSVKVEDEVLLKPDRNTASETVLASLSESVLSHMSLFNAQQLNSLIETFDQKGPTLLVNALCEQIHRKLGEFTKQQLSDLYVSLTRVSSPSTREVLVQLESEIEKKLNSYDSSELITILWVVGKLSASKRLVYKILRAIEKKMERTGEVQLHRRGQELSNLSITLGELGLYAENTFQKLASEVEKNITTMLPHQIALVLRGCALVWWHSPSLVSKCVNASKANFDKFSLEDLATLVWSLSRLNYNSQPVWAKLETVAEKKLDSLTLPLDPLVCGWLSVGFASAEVTEGMPKLILKLVKRAMSEPHQGMRKTSEAMSALGEALSTVNDAPAEIWNDFITRVLSQKIEDYTPVQLTQLAQAIAKGAPVSEIRTNLAEAIRHREKDLYPVFEARELQNLYHALCELGLPELTLSQQKVRANNAFTNQFGARFSTLVQPRPGD